MNNGEEPKHRRIHIKEDIHMINRKSKDTMITIHLGLNSNQIERREEEAKVEVDQDLTLVVEVILLLNHQ